MNNKKVIEQFKTERQDAERYAPPVLMTDDDLLYWYRLLDTALADRQANASHEPIPDKPRSRARVEFDEAIAKIADRQRNAPALPVLSYRSAQTETASAVDVKANASQNSEPPLHELLSALMRKVDRR